ncbi:MAG: MucR family transcriptional regulator [Magnetococcales bacterium]|nr:MucR family transcriptional regulator [Magnetococcales bacterium]
MSSDLVKRAASIVEAYVSNNELSPAEVAPLLGRVYASLIQISGGQSPEPEEEDQPAAAVAIPIQKEEPAAVAGASADLAAAPAPGKTTPAISLADSVSREAIYCLLCGKPCRAIKGHLTRSHKLSVDEYRTLFGLDKFYPLVAQDYSERRRQLAIDSGLGEKLRDARRKSRATGTQVATA